MSYSFCLNFSSKSCLSCLFGNPLCLNFKSNFNSDFFVFCILLRFQSCFFCILFILQSSFFFILLQLQFSFFFNLFINFSLQFSLKSLSLLLFFNCPITNYLWIRRPLSICSYFQVVLYFSSLFYSSSLANLLFYSCLIFSSFRSFSFFSFCNYISSCRFFFSG